MKRRTFLAGAGLSLAGAGLGISPLRNLAAAAAPTARRFVFMLSGNGFDARVLMTDEMIAFAEANRERPIPPNRRWGEQSLIYGPLGAPQILSGDLNGAPGLSGLGPLASKAAVVLGLSSRITGGGHGTSHGVLSSTRTIGGQPGGVTLDAYLAALPEVRGVGDQRSPVAAIRVGRSSRPGGIRYHDCAAGAGQPLPTVGSSEAAWTAYLGPLASEELRSQLGVRAEMLELARTGVERTTAPTERSALQLAGYGASLDDLLSDQARFRELAEGAPSAEVIDAPTDAVPFMDGLRDQCRNVAAALRFGVTNVAVVSVASGGGFHGVDYGSEFGSALAGKINHDMRHQYADDSADGEARRAAFFQVWREEINAFASIAQELEATPEPGGDGTMLDHTVMVYTSDNGDGHHSLAAEFPALVMGGGALGLVTGGRTLVYPDMFDGGAAHRQLSNLWQTVGGPVAGQTLDEFGTEGPTRIAAGPLPELLDAT